MRSYRKWQRSRRQSWLAIGQERRRPSNDTACLGGNEAAFFCQMEKRGASVNQGGDEKQCLHPENEGEGLSQASGHSTEEICTKEPGASKYSSKALSEED